MSHGIQPHESMEWMHYAATGRRSTSETQTTRQVSLNFKELLAMNIIGWRTIHLRQCNFLRLRSRGLDSQGRTSMRNYPGLSRCRGMSHFRHNYAPSSAKDGMDSTALQSRCKLRQRNNQSIHRRRSRCQEQTRVVHQLQRMLLRQQGS